MVDVSGLVERLKSNKLAIPAIAVGVVAGGYVLIKRGGLGGGGQLVDPALGGFPTDETLVGGGAGVGGGDVSGGNEAIGAVAAAQESLAKQVQDQLAKLVTDFQQALLYQNSQTQGAIDSIAGQTQGAIDAIAAQQQGLADQFSQFGQNQGGGLPDLSAFYTAMASLPQQIQNQAPQLGLNTTNLNQSLQNLAVRPISTQSLRLGGRVKSLTPTSGYSGRSALGLGGGYSFSKIGGTAKSLGSLSGYSGRSALGIGAGKPIAKPRTGSKGIGGSGTSQRK